MHISVNPEYFELIPHILSSKLIHVDQLVGMTITAVIYRENTESLLIHLNTHVLEMVHVQDCCETVYLADVVGDFEDLIGYPLLKVSESIVKISQEEPSSTASYYNFKTVKANVQLRWVEESSGYYSETIDCYLHPVGA